MAYSLHRAIALLAALLALAVPHAVAQQMVSVSGEEVYLRSGPGTKHPPNWVLGRGYPLKVIGRRGDWLEVRDFENDKGWIHRLFTSRTPYHIVKVNVASLLSQPTTSGRIIGKFVYGETLRTIERKSGWIKVQRARGLRGWVARRQLWGW